MAKKSAISGEYIIQVEDSGSVVVFRIYDNVKASLREIAATTGFEYNPDWNVRQFGKKLCKEFFCYLKFPKVIEIYAQKCYNKNA